MIVTFYFSRDGHFVFDISIISIASVSKYLESFNVGKNLLKNYFSICTLLSDRFSNHFVSPIQCKTVKLLLTVKRYFYEKLHASRYTFISISIDARNVGKREIMVKIVLHSALNCIKFNVLNLTHHVRKC